MWQNKMSWLYCCPDAGDVDDDGEDVWMVMLMIVKRCMDGDVDDSKKMYGW